MATVPVDARKVERLLTSFEKRLNRAEAKTIRSLVRGLLAGQNRLLGQLQPAYGFTLESTRTAGRALREARARELLRQVEGLLRIIPVTAERDLLELIETSASAGVESAGSLIRLYDTTLASSFAVLPREAMLAAASNSYARLLTHGEEFATKATQSIVSGIATGSSWRKVATEIKAQTGITRRQAETIVRTESAQAHDDAHRQVYGEQGIEYVQRLATLDVRVCGYCASRAGNVYKLEDAPAALHPNDRCRNIPWKPEWQAAGLTDDEWTRKHKAGVIQKLEDAGGKPHAGAAPFEKAAGLGAPKPVWSPGDPPLKPVAPPLLPGQFKTHDDARAWGRAAHPQIDFDLDGIHPDHLNPVFQRFEQLAREWPEVAQRLQYVGTGAGDTAYARDVRRTFQLPTHERAGAYVQRDGKVLALSPKVFGSLEEMAEFVRSTHSSGWLHKGTRDARALVAHEWGHLVDFHLRSVTKMGPLEYAGVDGVGTANGTLQRWREKFKPTAKNVSTYATTNEDEAFAETFGAVTELPRSQWTAHMRRFNGLLDELRPDQLVEVKGYIGELQRGSTERQAALDAWNALKRRLELE